MKRRDFITLPAKAMGGVLLYTLAGEPVRLQAQQGTVRVPLRFFTAGGGARDRGRLRTDFSERRERSGRYRSGRGGLH